ncbi:MAG: c-type cytochrome [Saprospiraceae bacterium]|nr:c-type cytochrome [Saprospiraceae bacterium]
MLLLRIGSLLLLGVSIICCKTETTSKEVNVEPISTSALEVLDFHLIFSEQHLDTISVKVEQDPFFLMPKRYKGIALMDVLSKYAPNMLKDTAGRLLVFECTDGYQPTMPISLAMNYPAYVVFQDEDAEVGKQWLDSVVGKFAPYYLVWQVDSVVSKGLPNPYGLVRMSFQSFETQYANAYPKGDDLALAGFEVYKKHCIKCHSINKAGGNVGPELNYPKNITEYWRKEDMWNFIQHPQSYRYNSKMPAQHISKDDFDW